MFKEKLLALMGEEKPYSWAAKHNIAKSTMHNIIKSGRAPGADQLLKISKAANVSIDWLLSDERIQESETMPPSSVADSNSDIIWLAVIGENNLINEKRMPFSNKWISHYSSDSKNLMIAFQPNDSMEPTLSKNDLLLIDKVAIDIHHAGLYLVKNNNSIETKRIQCGINNEIILGNDNKKYKDIAISNKDIEDLNIMGKVVMFFHGL